jgi:hypothetical protein
MDQIEKNPNDKMTKLENEIKVLKNEVQAVLLDLRESYLNMENPFNTSANPAATQSIVITERAPARDTQADNYSRGNQNPEPFKAEKNQTTGSKKLEEHESENNPAQSEYENYDSERERKAENLPITEHEPRTSLREKMGKPLNPPVQLEAKPLNSAETGARKPIKLDLVTMAGLTGWVEQSVKNIGRERSEAVLEISEAMGYVSPELKPILVKLITLAQPSPDENKASTRNYMDSLIKINSLLGSDNREETALILLSLVSGEPNHG